MPVGTSGRNVYALCYINANNYLSNGTYQYNVVWNLTEPFPDSPFPTETIADNPVYISIERTDSEIEAFLREETAAAISNRYQVTMTSTDIRGVKI